MTRNCEKKITAITLCIVLVLSTLCTFARVTDTNHENAQFFAASFSDLSTGKASTPSLSGSGSTRIVTWLRNPEPIAENNMVFQIPKSSVNFFADKLLNFKNILNDDIYNEFKKVEYFLRI